MLSCSRGTLREILRELEHSGYITKKHSIGNFIHPSAFSMKGRVAQFPRFTELIQDAGMGPRVLMLDKDEDGCGEPPHRQVFQTTPDFFADTDYSVHLYFANERPAICCDCYVPRAIIFRSSDHIGQHISLFDYLNQYCNQQIEQVCVHFYIEEAGPRLSRLLAVPEGTALLMWEECYYNFCDEVICVAYNYFNIDVLPLSMLRRYEGKM